MTDSRDEPNQEARGCFFRFNGVFLIIASLAMAVIGWFVLATLAGNLAKTREHARDVAPFALWCINHRAWLSVLVIPSIIGGVILMNSRRRSVFWLVLILTSFWVFALFGLILYSFVMFMKPLYEYHPL